jgi:hypothetical protein
MESDKSEQVAPPLNTPAAAPVRSGRGYSVAALVFALLGLALFPPGGIIAIICGSLARSRGDRTLGLIAVVAGIISFFASFYIASLVLD